MKSFGVILALMSSVSFAAEYSDPSTVKGITIGDGYIRVKLDSMKDAQACDDQGWYALDTSDDFGKMSFSGILSSKAAHSKLTFQLSGCLSAGSKIYPKINHVYLCDNPFCG